MSFADDGCPYIAGPACRDCNGRCWYPDTQQLEPDPADTCAAGDHRPYGQDEIEGVTVERCYCGAQVYPVGGAS